jgi:radical SAM protein with 4Fe4S-binding SPASM domain
VIILKLEIKPLLCSYYLPCLSEFKNWKKYLDIFKSKYDKMHISESDGVKNEFTLRYDGFGFLKGENPIQFRLSKEAVRALNIYYQNFEFNREEKIKIIAKEEEISEYQVDAFLRLFEKYVPKSDFRYIESPFNSQIKYLNLPLTIQWEITGTCNLKCVHCYADATEKTLSGELTSKQIFHWIDQFSKYGIQSIHLLGGEPFMRKDILGIIEKITQKDIFCYISTNGTLIDVDIAKKLSNYEKLAIDVSLDGTCSKTHDSFRGVEGTYDKVLKTLKLMKKNEILMNVTCVLGRHNISEIDELIDVAIHNNAKRIQFLTLSSTGRGAIASKKLGFQDRKKSIIREELVKYILNYLDKIYIDAPFLGLSPYTFRLLEILNFQGFDQYYDMLLGCNAGLTKMGITHTGKIILCPQVRKGFGNIEKLGFLEGWKSLNRYAKQNLICKVENCEYKKFCGGKCRIK